MARFIRDMMLDANLYPEDLPKGLSRQTVRGYGQCHCTNNNCTSSWGSAFTWMTFDLYQQRVCKKYQQKCQSCGTLNIMHVRPDDLVLMIDFALYRVIGILEGTWNSSTPSTKGNADGDEGDENTLPKKKPHKRELCEKCQFGLLDCRERSARPQRRKGGKSKKKSLKESRNQTKETQEEGEQQQIEEEKPPQQESKKEEKSPQDKESKDKSLLQDKKEEQAPQDKESKEKSLLQDKKEEQAPQDKESEEKSLQDQKEEKALLDKGEEKSPQQEMTTHQQEDKATQPKQKAENEEINQQQKEE